MKKLFALALAFAAIFSAQAQDAKTLYEQAKKLDDAFTKALPTQIKPDQKPNAEQAQGLLDAMEIYQKVMELDQMPNEKGQVKPKYTDKIQKSLLKHTVNNDFFTAGLIFNQQGMNYPQAYEAFMLSGQMQGMMGAVPDTIYAADFVNAGNMAYGQDFKAAAAAYTAARQANTQNENAYVYNIGALQQIAVADSTYKTATKDIAAIAKEGIDRFGYGNDFLVNNYLQSFFEDGNFEGALAELAKIESADPKNANVYRLRGIISNAKHDYLNAIPAFKKMAELTDNADYLLKAAGDLNSIGKAIMGNLNAPTPEAKSQLLDIFNAALHIAEKAAQNPEAASQAQYDIDDIKYNIENAEKL